MATEVKIPAMGESISSGILAVWHVKDGDYVEKDQVLYELETDKITSEANAEVSGTIKILIQADEEVDIGQTVAEIDESASGGASQSEAKAESAPEPETAAPEEKEKPKTEDAAPSASTSPKAEPSSALSPAARKAAAETGVDTNKIDGSGKDGRVTKGDILEAASKPAPAPAKAEPKPASPTTTASASSESRETRKKMSPLRRKIAERLVTATQECALLTTFNEVDMSSVMKLRKQHQEKFVEKHGIKLGFMSFFTKAVTHALQAIPAVNSRIEGNEIVTQHFYDIGVAVGTEKGLMVPVIRNVEGLSFAAIEQAIMDVAGKARQGRAACTQCA
jgi:2-oxoglutarate dehydrogenase E2 component (dihydrolipoamide succinyltransferase)